MRYEYKGVVHLHSYYSDGHATVEEIVAKAQEAALDFVMLSDHNDVTAKRMGYERWHGGTLLVVGNEISPPTHHYLAFGIEEELHGEDYADPYEMVADVASRGGLGIIAHPFGGHSRLPGIRPCPWTIWDTDRYDGIEIWSYMVDWVEGLSLWTLFYYYLHPERAIHGPPHATLAKWDEVAQQRRVIGIGSVDAHGKPFPIFRFLKFLPYAYVFRTIRTHVLASEPLSTDAGQAVVQLIEAIRQGRCFVGYDFLADASGFRFHDADGRWHMGDEFCLSQPFTLQAHLPEPAQVRLIRDGAVCVTQEGKRLDYFVERPGVYRIEAFLDGTPWIYSNPLFVRAQA